MKNRLLIILLITLLNLTSGGEARGNRPGDVVKIGQGKSFLRPCHRRLIDRIAPGLPLPFEDGGGSWR